MSRRIEQVADEIRRLLGPILQEEVKDPRVGFATVMRVEVSADLKHAKIFVSVLGDEEQRRDTMRGLRSAVGFLRRRLAQDLRHMRSMPELHFELDTSLDYTMHINQLLETIKNEPPPKPPEPAASNEE